NVSEAVAPCSLACLPACRLVRDKVADLHPLARAEDRVDARHGPDDRAVAFGHAAGGDEALAGRLAGGQLAQHAKRFVARGGDEATGVDDHDIGLIGLRDWGVPLRGENAAHAFAIDSVLGASEGDDMIFHSAFGVLAY